MNTIISAAKFWSKPLSLLILCFALFACTSEPKRVIHRAKDNRKIYHQDDSRKNSSKALKKPYVILVSIDGFRHDYIEKFKPAALSSIAEQGVSAKSLVPTYPSLTFPNHYSMVTGLDAGTHGIVANHFWAKDLGAHYTYRNPDLVSDGRFYGGSPIWVDLEKQNTLTAAMFWVGSEAEIQGVRPTYYFDYDHYYPNDFRVKQVLDWLALPEDKRPHFITLYFSDVDSAGHRFGPESSQVKHAIEQVDNAIGKLMEGLKALKLPVNVMVVSDHGMVKVSDSIDVHELIDSKNMEGIRVVGRGALMHFYGEDRKKLRKAYKLLKLEEDNFKVYWRKNSPKRFKMRKQVRFGEFFIESKPGYYLRFNDSKEIPQGSHGWDAKSTMDTHGFFVAKGPAFQAGDRYPSLKNTKIKKIVMDVFREN